MSAIDLSNLTRAELVEILRAHPSDELYDAAALVLSGPLKSEAIPDPSVKIETSDVLGDMRALVANKCVAVAWQTGEPSMLREAPFLVVNVWQGGTAVSALSHLAAKTVLRRMASDYIVSAAGLVAAE